MADIESLLKLSAPLDGMLSVNTDGGFRVNASRLQWRDTSVNGARRRWDLKYKTVLASAALMNVYNFNSKLCDSLLDHLNDMDDTIEKDVLVDLKDFDLQHSVLIDLLRVASENRSLDLCTRPGCESSFPARKCACGKYHCTPTCALTDCDLVWCRNGKCKNNTTQLRTVGCSCFPRLCGHIHDGTAQCGEVCFDCDQPDYASRHCNCQEALCSDCQEPMKLLRFTSPEDAQTEQEERDKILREEVARLQRKLDEIVSEVEEQKALNTELENKEAAMKLQMSNKDLVIAKLMAWIMDLNSKNETFLHEIKNMHRANTPTPPDTTHQSATEGVKRTSDGDELHDASRPTKQLRTSEEPQQEVAPSRTVLGEHAPSLSSFPPDSEQCRFVSDSGFQAVNREAIGEDTETAGGPESQTTIDHLSSEESSSTDELITTNGRSREGFCRPHSDLSWDTCELERNHLQLMIGEKENISVAKIKEMLAIIYNPKYSNPARCGGIATLPYRPSRKPMLDFIYKRGDKYKAELAEEHMDSIQFRNGMFRILYRYLRGEKEKSWGKEKASEFASCLHTLWCIGDSTTTKHDHKAWNKIGIEVYWELVHSLEILDIIIDRNKSYMEAERTAIDTLGIFGDRVLPCIVSKLKSAYQTAANRRSVQIHYNEHKAYLQSKYQKIKQKVDNEPNSEVDYHWQKDADLTSILQLAGPQPDSATIMSVVSSVADMHTSRSVVIDLYAALVDKVSLVDSTGQSSQQNDDDTEADSQQ